MCEARCIRGGGGPQCALGWVEEKPLHPVLRNWYFQITVVSFVSDEFSEGEQVSEFRPGLA